MWMMTIIEKDPMSNKKQEVVDLLKSGESAPATAINADTYIQHNPTIGDRFRSAKVRTVRVFQDGDFVFTHSEYDLSGSKIGFDIFRFEDGKIVEHWDNLQETAVRPSPSGHSMIDGPTTASDLDKTGANKALMRQYMDDLLNQRKETFPSYFDGINYIQHNPWVGDQLTGLAAGLQALAKQGSTVKYDRVHLVLGEGNFVLVVSEGWFGDRPTAYYDMYRIENEKIAEHWDTLETIPPREQWKNANGKF
jgi:predicted SnoaL-like aldol condensation-catalyzing enzyme